jgi:hypothetical protein
MAHDKIKAAARRRMAETGESYAAARREVIREFRAASNHPAGEPERFAISYDDMGPISTWADTLLQQVRGSQTFWRISSAVNTLGSIGYWQIGRRYRRSQPPPVLGGLVNEYERTA